MTQTIEDEISLEELIKRSTYILVVKKSEPESTVEKIRIHEDTAKYPPFEKTVHHFQVIEELFVTPKDIDGKYKPGELAGKNIDVMPSKIQDKLDLHKHFYLDGWRKSPIVKTYNSTANFNEKTLVVFLNVRLEFAVENAYESLSKKKEILKIVNESSKAK